MLHPSMLSSCQPSLDAIKRQLAAQAPCDFSYPDPGITKSPDTTAQPHSYVVDHTRCGLGRGQEVYQAAIEALTHWRQFSLGWLSAVPDDTPLEPGRSVAIVARVVGVWSVHCARIVYSIDDHQGPTHRFGFAYGTLPAHMEAGEERFQVEWNTVTDEVLYDILAYSRPRHLLAKFGYPLVRRLQKRFGRESAARMQSLTRIN
jgi:uncharacterized protein (UPF0548 family)